MKKYWNSVEENKTLSSLKVVKNHYVIKYNNYYYGHSTEVIKARSAKSAIKKFYKLNSNRTASSVEVRPLTVNVYEYK